MTTITKQRAVVDGRQMAYVDVRHGDRTFVLLHGNPTSSYLWRNVIPHLPGRCVAPDLIGMGDSDKLPDAGPGSYRFATHRRFLDGLLDAVELPTKVLLVVHDWGSALGFDWARRHPDRVAGIAYMEAIVRPMSWEEWREQTRAVFQALRSPAGEQMVLADNAFVEQVLPRAILRELTPEEIAEYRRPRTRVRGGARRSTGRASCRSTASPPTSSSSSTRTGTGCRPPSCRSCSSTQSRVRSSPAPRASSAAPGPTSARRRSAARISSRRTRRRRSARPSPPGRRRSRRR